MRTIVIAPHPDDEILGCGGSLLKRKAKGGIIGWVIITSINNEEGWDDYKIQERQDEITKIKNALNIFDDNIYQLGFPTTKLDIIPIAEIVKAISNSFNHFLPDEVFIPYPSDAHSDHRVTFEASSACTKWFRFPSIKKVLAYETISETDFNINPNYTSFNPTIYENIDGFLKAKLELMNIYKSEINNFPFPRSRVAIESLAKLRGSQSGFNAAEAFLPLRLLIN